MHQCARGATMVSDLNQLNRDIFVGDSLIEVIPVDVRKELKFVDFFHSCLVFICERSTVGHLPVHALPKLIDKLLYIRPPIESRL